MRGGHRPTLQNSLRNNAHADIETPSWRQYVPNCDNINDSDTSDDDTTAEAYIKRHHQLALEERRRWAGSAATNPSSTPNATPRPRAKFSAKHNIPLFPTPTEASLLVRSALNAFQEKNHVSSTSVPQDMLSKQSHVLEALETTLTSFAEVEEKLRSAKIRLKAAVNAHAYHRVTEETARHPGSRTFTEFGCPFSFNTPVHRESSLALSPNLYGCNGTFGSSASRSISQPSTPPLPSIASPLISKDSIVMINKQAHSKADLIEEYFRSQTSEMKDDMRALALQAQISVPKSASFQTMSASITRALRSHRAAKSEGNPFSLRKKRNDDSSNKLETLIRRAIGAKKYPLLARSFKLDPEYCLDGTRKPIEMVALGNGINPEPDQNDRKPWEGLRLLEPQTNDEPTCLERRRCSGERIVASRAQQEPVECVNGNGFGVDPVEIKKAGDNDLMLTPSFQTRRLDVRRKLRQNVKRKLPRIHKERRTRKAFRFRDSAESVSSRSSGALGSPSRWNSFREDGVGGMAIARRPSVTVEFQPVVDIDDKEDGTEPSVVYLDDEG